MVDTVSTQHPSQSAPWWMGALSGVAAAAVALASGQFIEGVSDTMPGLVLGVGELIIDYTPGWAAEESIENLGTAGKGNLLLGITIVAFLLAGLLGEQALKRGDRVGVEEGVRGRVLLTLGLDRAELDVAQRAPEVAHLRRQGAPSGVSWGAIWQRVAVHGVLWRCMAVRGRGWGGMASHGSVA